MKYYINKSIQGDFESVEKSVRELLKSEGFGILTEIDVKEKFKEKLDVDFRRYKILGACNPPFAHKALLVEDKIGTMLPCNVILQELENDTVEVAAIDPLASMMAIENTDLKTIAETIREKLSKVIQAV